MIRQWEAHGPRYLLPEEAGRWVFTATDGLSWESAGQAVRLLGLEVVDAANLARPLPLVTADEPPEVFARQNVLWARFGVTAARRVECQGRWEVAGHRVDLEVSALTPGQWLGLAVTTSSHLPEGEFELIETQDAGHPLVVFRPKQGEWTYLEMCHPHDGALFEVAVSGASRFRLFEHDLEKGVILRGRLRGLLLPGAAKADAALAAYGGFLKEQPNLSL